MQRKIARKIFPRYPQEVDAIRRWKRGHHLFFVLIQGLILSLTKFKRAMVEGDVGMANECLRIATDLMWGSAVAFRFAGDFSEEQYQAVVRPSMEPPYVNEGFSGLNGADHANLIRLLRSLKPTFETLPAPLRAQHRSFRRALDVAYESHVFVCREFVQRGKSLKQSEKVEIPAHELLRTRFKHRARAMVAGQRRQME